MWRSSSTKPSEYPDLSNPLSNKRNQDSFKAWPILRLVQIIHEMSLQQLLVPERKAVLSKKKKIKGTHRSRPENTPKAGII